MKDQSEQNYRLKIALIIAAVIVCVEIGALIANGLQSVRYTQLLAFAKCDDRGAVFLKFADGSEWNCIPRDQVPPNKPPAKK